MSRLRGEQVVLVSFSGTRTTRLRWASRVRLVFRDKVDLRRGGEVDPRLPRCRRKIQRRRVYRRSRTSNSKTWRTIPPHPARFVRVRRGGLRPRRADRHRTRHQPGPGRGAREGIPRRDARPQAGTQQTPARRPARHPRPEDALAAGPARERLRRRRPVQVPVRHRRGGPADRQGRARLRKRQELRLDRTQPRSAGLLGLHHREPQVTVGVSCWSVSPRKNAPARACHTNITTTPSTRTPTPSTKTVPRPNTEPPLP